MTQASPAPAELQPGARFGRYRIRRQLAAGGMATVYVAQLDGAAGFGKLVALKRIHPHLAREVEFVRMFLDEARLTSRISHANVCSVTDFGEQDGTFFLAMELLHGESFSAVLRACVRAGVPPLERARLFVKLLADACEGLHAAHELRDDHGAPMQVVHRDVSPQNLFVTQDGVAKVLDFGIAKARHRLQDETVGQIKGKFAYMSPEQVRGGVLDRRTDVWALGVVAWEMLAAKRLFRRETEMETMFAVTSADVPPLSSVAPELGGELDGVIARALARDPDARIATARELGRELLGALAKTASVPSLHEVAERMVELFPDADAKRLRVESTPPPAEPPVVVPGGADALADTRPASPVAKAIEPRGAPRRPSAIGVASIAVLVAIAGGAWWLTPSGAPLASLAAPVDAGPPRAPDASVTHDAPALPDAAPPPDAIAPDTGRAAGPVRTPPRPGPSRDPLPPPVEPPPLPTEPPPPAETGVGSLRLRTQLRIDELRIDGSPRNPIATHTLPAGEHEVVVVPSDGIARTRTVRIEPDRRVQLEVPWW